MVVGKHLICQKVIVPTTYILYMKDRDENLRCRVWSETESDNDRTI